MKYFKLTFLVLGLLHYDCNRANRQNTATTDKTTIDTVTIQTDKEKFEESLEDYKIDSIKVVISVFKENNFDKISSKIDFPLYREYPIPPVKDKEEFRQRFSEVFDKTLIDKIINSKIEQWSEVGWRGIMLDNGVLWMANSDGVITAVNYQSDFEKKLRADLIAKDKQNLHASLKILESPTYKIKTKKYLIRIDELSDHNYRYASWKTGEKESSKPDIILENGELKFHGSGGNHVITFVNGNYTYNVYRNIIGKENSPGLTLHILKDGEIILIEDGTLILD